MGVKTMFAFEADPLSPHLRLPPDLTHTEAQAQKAAAEEAAAAQAAEEAAARAEEQRQADLQRVRSDCLCKRLL